MGQRRINKKLVGSKALSKFAARGNDAGSNIGEQIQEQDYMISMESKDNAQQRMNQSGFGHGDEGSQLGQNSNRARAP